MTQTEQKQKHEEFEKQKLLTSGAEIDHFVSEKQDIEVCNSTGQLSSRLKRFCEEYVIDYKPAKAAERSGIDPWNAYSYAKHALNSPVARDYISDLEEQVSLDLNITRQRVIQEYSKIAFSSPKDFYDDEGRLIPIHQLDRDSAAQIKRFKIEDRSEGFGDDKEYFKIVDIELHSKLKALGDLAKYFGIFEKDNKQKTEMGFKEFLQTLPKDVREEIKFALMKRIGKG